MSKDGQRRNARQPVSQAKGRPMSQPRRQEGNRQTRASFIQAERPPMDFTQPEGRRQPSKRQPTASAGRGPRSAQPEDRFSGKRAFDRTASTARDNGAARRGRGRTEGLSENTGERPEGYRSMTLHNVRNEEGQGNRRDRQERAPFVKKAKKLAVRNPNQKMTEQARRLREGRVDLDDVEPMRLQKVLAASGAGSRREVEELIEAGLVLLNGKPAQLGDKAGPHDRVMVKGHPIKLKWPDRLPRIIMYHKQEGEIVSRDDPQGRVTVFARLPQASSSRWVAVGRLDVNTSGLLLITTSGELANRMMHPRFEVEREYAVRVLGELTPEIIEEMTSGVELEDGEACFTRVYQTGTQGREDGANRWYNVTIKEGRNREVRRMFEHFNLTVSRLMRVRFGQMVLPPRLKRGQFYELNQAEVASVLKWLDMPIPGAPVRKGRR